MALVALGVDALDPELVDAEEHPNLVLEEHRAIETIVSSTGSPSTHELWPTIITGLPPEEHGLTIDDGVAWEARWLRYAGRVADYALPDSLQTWIGAWLLNTTSQDAFRTPASYYEDRNIETVFDETESVAIGIPNYVVDTNTDDRENQLRREMGELFERDPETATGHTSTDPELFYEWCLEMVMIRIARVRRALRGGRYELVFGYTSGLDLVGHVAHDDPHLQSRSYRELDEFVGELRGDLRQADELLLVSDHGLQNGLHTESAMISATSPAILDGVESVLDVRRALERELSRSEHQPRRTAHSRTVQSDDAVRDHLEDLGYM